MADLTRRLEELRDDPEAMGRLSRAINTAKINGRGGVKHPRAEAALAAIFSYVVADLSKRPESSDERPIIRVVPGNGGRDSEDFAQMLRGMYAAWDGDLDGEAGVHRLVRKSPHDPEHRRHTAFARVCVDEDIGAGDGQIRSYFLYPEERVKDHQTGRETHDAYRVLGGDLSLIREVPNAD